MKIGLLGLGTVGCGAVEIIQKNQRDIKGKTGTDIQVTKALVRDLNQPRLVPIEGIELTTNPQAVLADPEIDIIVEVMGGVTLAKDYIIQALQNGKYVVTANKDLLAQYGKELFEIASLVKRNIYYEASVGGGIPLIRPFKHCLAANRIKSVMGIINGTTNFILTQMSVAEKEFKDALEEAQAKGFAEQDPSSDLEGRDAAYKLAILSSLAFNSKIDVSKVYTESITKISLRDIMYAKELGFAIKLLAIGEETDAGLSLRVHPTLVPEAHPLATVHNEFNALYLQGDAVGEVMFYGRGAGSLPTGSAVVSDIIDVVRNINHQVDNGILETTFPSKPLVPMEEKVSRFYVRMKATDEHGVFGSVATVFGDEQISLDMILQKRRDFNVAEIVLVTHDVKEAQFNRALCKIQSLVSIRNLSNVIRVLERS